MAANVILFGMGCVFLAILFAFLKWIKVILWSWLWILIPVGIVIIIIIWLLIVFLFVKFN